MADARVEGRLRLRAPEQGKVNSELTAEAQRRERATVGGASNNDQGEGFSAGAAVAAGEVQGGANAWVCCAFLAPETPEQEAARLAAMPGKYDAVSPIHRPREFARALAAMVAEQVGPQGRTMLLRSTAGGQVFRTAHRSQTLYHGPVVYADDPYRRLESASSALEFALLRIFMKPAAHRGQREYRFAAWTHGESGPDRVDLEVSPALLDAMQRRPIESEGGGLASAVLGEPNAVEEVNHRSPSGAHVLVEAPPAGYPAIVPRRYGAEGPPGDSRETAAAHAAVEALRAAVGQLGAESSRDAAAAAWHAESVVRFFCSTYAGTIAAVRVNEDSFIVLRAEVLGGDVTDVTIAVVPPHRPIPDHWRKS